MIGEAELRRHAVAAGVDTMVQDLDYGLESYQARVYYRGPLRWGGPPRAIQLDVSRGEPLLFPITMRALHHTYSDANQLPPVAIPCYDLAEMLTEKLRAISGQRRFAVSRDIYDIHQLIGQGVSLAAIRQALPAKLAAKGLPPDRISAAGLAQRRAVFETDWEHRLAHLLPPQQPVTFDAAWQSVVKLVAALEPLDADSIGGSR